MLRAITSAVKRSSIGGARGLPAVNHTPAAGDIHSGPAKARLNVTAVSQGLDRLLTTAEVAERLRVSISFLAKARVTGVGPRFIKVGRSCRYRVSDLESYERSRARTSTSEH